MADIGAELLEKIRAEFQKSCKADKYIQSVLKKIEGGTAKMEEVALLSKQLGFRASQAIGAHVNVAALPDGKMYYNIADTILTGVLKDNYDIINSAATECQKALDSQAGINITPQQAEFPTERIQAVVNAASVPDIAEEIMIRRMTAPAQNITESFYNDYVQKNVKLRSDAGLDCYIIRNDHGGCCKWCSKLAGKYHYPEDVPKDVYRRHDNCGCTVTYLNGRNAQDVWSKTKWNVSDEELEQMKKAGSRQPVRLDKRGGSGIIKMKDIPIGKSIGAKAKNYDILDPQTGEYFNFVEGTKIQNPKVFAGKGGTKPLNPEVADGLSKQIGGKPENWQHLKGIGVIDYYGEEVKAEVHWFQEESVGKHKFKVKRWLDNDD